MADHCMIFFHGPTPTLADAGRLLAERGLQVAASDDRVAVRSAPDGPVLRLALARGPHVARDAEALSRGTPHDAAMRRFDARFEIEIADLATVLDEINTLIEVQLTLQEATRGYVYTSWNSAICAPLS
jgi:hypothetical protein